MTGDFILGKYTAAKIVMTCQELVGGGLLIIGSIGGAVGWSRGIAIPAYIVPLGLVAFGLTIVAAAQLGRAMIDTADNTHAILMKMQVQNSVVPKQNSFDSDAARKEPRLTSRS
jgi:hypothetical protein